MTKRSSKKTSPDAASQLSVTTVEEQGILESFFKLPQAERRIIRKLLEKSDPQQVGVICLPVPFGPKEYKERRNFLSPVYKLMRYHRLTFDSIANGALRWTYLPWIESITHVKAGEEEELELRLNSNYEKVWRTLKQRLGKFWVWTRSRTIQGRSFSKHRLSFGRTSSNGRLMWLLRKSTSTATSNWSWNSPGGDLIVRSRA